jgi:hypothetical protein
LPVAVRLTGGLFVVYENPFPADDPRHALTGELLDILTHEEPGWTGGRAPWRPDLVERIRAQHAAAAPAQAQFQALIAARLRDHAARRATRTRGRGPEPAEGGVSRRGDGDPAPLGGA